MGVITNFFENASTGKDATFSMMGYLESYNTETGKGTIKWAGKTYLIDVNLHTSLKAAAQYIVFPLGIPDEGMSVLFNTDPTKTYAIQVVASSKRDRGLMNYLEYMVKNGMLPENYEEVYALESKRGKKAPSSSSASSSASGNRNKTSSSRPAGNNSAANTRNASVSSTPSNKSTSAQATKSSSGDFMEILVSIVCIILVIVLVRNVSTSLKAKKEQKIIESHDWFLSEDDIKTRDKLDEKYKKMSDVDIHVTQANVNDVVDCPDDAFIWLIINDYGNQAGCELESNYLADAERESLWQDVKSIYEGDTVDIEKCEQFYDLAYMYVQNHLEKYTEVPNLIGISVDAAEELAKKQGLSLQIEENLYSEIYANGIIMEQSITEGEQIEKNTILFIKVSKGMDERPEVPNLVGMDVENARKLLESYQLNLYVQSEIYSSYEKNTIIAQEMDEGTKVESGEVINVSVSLGEKIPVNVLPNDFFELQRKSLMKTISKEDIFDYFGINDKFCDISDGTYEDGYEKTILSFPTTFYGFAGVVNCELYESVDQTLIYFQWVSDESGIFFDIYDALCEAGFEDILSDGPGLFLTGVESVDGAISFSSSQNGPSQLRFSAY